MQLDQAAWGMVVIEVDAVAATYQNQAKEDNRKRFQAWCLHAVQDRGGHAAHAFGREPEQFPWFPDDILDNRILYS